MAAPRYLRLNDTNKKKEEGLAVQITTGPTDANKIVSTGTDGLIDPSFIPGGEVIVREASEALDGGDFVNVFDDAGAAKVRKADASAFSTRAIGFVKDNAASGANARIFGEGILGGLSGLTIGTPQFLSLNSGEVTETPPTGTAEIWQMVGYAISATEIMVEIGEAIVRN